MSSRSNGNLYSFNSLPSVAFVTTSTSFCVTPRANAPTCPTDILARYGDGRVYFDANVSTFCENVAENKSVCRPFSSVGILPRLPNKSLNCGSNPRSSIRSASSNTNIRTSRKSTYSSSQKSSKRPGVHTKISGPNAMCSSCGLQFSPPCAHATRRPVSKHTLRTSR